MSLKKFEIALATLIFSVLFAPMAITAIDSAAPESTTLALLMTANLNGVVLDEARPVLSKDSWLSGAFQSGYARWFGQRFAGREQLIRLSNQIDYSLFRKSSMDQGKLIIGKEKQLFERTYVTDYVGIDPPMPTDRLETIVRQMADIQARLQKLHIAFVVLVTPSKASLYPQYIPDAFMRVKQNTPRNYDNLVELLDRFGVHYVDGHRITATAIQNNSLPLFCRGGIHWNGLGASYTLGALTEKIGELSNITPPRLVLDGVDVAKVGRGQDEDLALLLNVIWIPEFYPTPHPRLHFEHKADKTRIVLVGGSFVQRLTETLDRNHVFGSMDFYYYWNEKWTYPGQIIMPINRDKIDWKHQILDANAIVLEMNEEALQSGVELHYTKFLDDAQKHLPK